MGDTKKGDFREIVISEYFFIGPCALKGAAAAAILNSRHSKYPVGADAWIQASVEAVRNIAAHDLALVTSLGMHSWELPLALAGQNKIPTLVVVPAITALDDNFVKSLCHRFCLDEDKFGLICLPHKTNPDQKKWWPARDLCIAESAGVLFPVSIKPEGRLEKLISSHPNKIDNRFRISWNSEHRHRPHYPVTRLPASLQKMELLIHFTRTAAGPWPGETEAEFYRNVLASHGCYCHSASATLQRILTEKKIRASDHHLRNGNMAVAWCELNRINSARMFAYRSRMVNPGFEPYGIAIPKKTALDRGIRPVIYGTDFEYNMLAPERRPYFQNEGRRGGWRGENEWRHLGDFDLTTLPLDDITIILPTDDEKAEFESSGYRLMAL